VDPFFVDVLDRACLAESQARGYGYQVRDGQNAYHDDVADAVFGALQWFSGLRIILMIPMNVMCGIRQLSPGMISVLAELEDIPDRGIPA
jgi:hypothetical protein